MQDALPEIVVRIEKDRARTRRGDVYHRSHSCARNSARGHSMFAQDTMFTIDYGSAQSAQASGTWGALIHQFV
jgi:hypothetical protein